jgi:CelD/BcsL family acetyltransferase involved in cellulose biosynthesis
VVYFYQAGIDYARFAEYGSPGLLLLTRAVEHALAAGHSRFEFMAGDAAYKRKLSTAEGELIWLSLDRVGLGSQLRNTARWLRQQVGAVVS